MALPYLSQTRDQGEILITRNLVETSNLLSGLCQDDLNTFDDKPDCFVFVIQLKVSGSIT